MVFFSKAVSHQMFSHKSRWLSTTMSEGFFSCFCFVKIPKLSHGCQSFSDGCIMNLMSEERSACLWMFWSAVDNCSHCGLLKPDALETSF